MDFGLFSSCGSPSHFGLWERVNVLFHYDLVDADALPNPEQKPQLAAALSAVALRLPCRRFLARRSRARGPTGTTAKRTMMAMDFANGCLSVLLAGLVTTNMLNLPVLIALMVIAALFGSFTIRRSIRRIAMPCPEEQLPRAKWHDADRVGLSGILRLPWRP